jgi:lipopolysaccharide transport system ATP-binding protein
MTDTAVRAVGLSKRYQLGAAIQGRLTETLWDAMTWPARVARGASENGRRRRFIWALKDVSLEAAEGEAIGIIGRNGAGKSTLLKILSRITEPTEGYAEVTGRVGSLLEVGVGFHPDLTGAENTYLYGSILGMSRGAVKKKFDEIVNFAEIEEFVDTPVKRYSSGMYTRLAFSVAAHLEADILIVDEVLAVGDVGFQKKCFGKMEEAYTSGRTILFVSHNLPAISSLCQRAYLLERGQIIRSGAAAEVVDHFSASLRAAEETPLAERTDRLGDQSVHLVALSIQDADSAATITPTSSLRLVLHYQSKAPVRGARFVVTINDSSHGAIFRLDSHATGGLPDVLPPSGSVTCVTEPIHLTPGTCTVTVAVFLGDSVADAVEYASSFEVQSAGFHGWTSVPARKSVLTLRRHAWSAESS